MMRCVRDAAVAVGLLGLVAAAGAVEPDPATPQTKDAHRTRVLRSWPEDVRMGRKLVPARVELLFDYTAGVAIQRVVIETKKGRAVLKTETFPPGVNVPGPSLEEIEEAMAIVRADAEIARLIRNADGILDGGFEIFEPAGSPCGPGTRCLKIQINTADRLGLIRNVVVDLTRQAIAYRAWAPEWSGGKK